MKKTAKKLISLIIAAIMIMSLAATAFAKDANWISQSLSDIPVIRISGDGEPLVDKDGNKIFHYKDAAKLLTGDGKEDGNNEMLESIATIIKPFLLDGLLKDEWDGFYDSLYTEISKLFAKSLLDKNGNAQGGSGLRQERIDHMNNIRHNDQAWYTSDGTKYYNYNEYWFRYDWRLDPIKTAGDFKAYVDDIIASTGCDKVGIVASCLGTNVITAYLAVYPEHAAKSIRGVAYDGSVVGGAEILSEVICAKFKVDPTAVNRILIDCDATGLFSVDEFINVTIEMLDRTGVLDTLIGTTEKLLYDKLVEGVTSALALSTFYTWPNYWACVSPEDYESAKYYVFGAEGSEKRKEYAGLIEQLDNYDRVVRQRIPEVLTQTVNNGVHFGAISKYGFQNMPICETSESVSDQFASVKRSSFGATTGTIYRDLSEKYIASRVEAGFGKYISPDKQIDASTCLFPDNTWFIKGSSHSNWSDWEVRLLYDIASSKQQLTVNNSCSPSQFVVFYYTNPDDANDGEIEAMTAENCDVENWESDESVDKPANFIDRIIVAVKAIAAWFKALIQKISEK